jgi:hypothetical protein
MLVCVVLSCFMDTSGFAAIGAGVLFAVLVFVAGMLSLYFGICAIRSRKDRNQGTVGVIFGLLVVGAAISIVLYCYISSYIEDKHIVAARVAEERAEKAAYDASPDIESNIISTLLQSPHLNVTIYDIAAFPGGKILVHFSISGGRAGSKLLVYSADGKQDTEFAFESKGDPNFYQAKLTTAPNGNFLFVSEEMKDIVLRNRKGKRISGTIEDSGNVRVVRFNKSGKLFGIEWLPTVYRYNENDEKAIEKNLAVNLVEMPLNGKAFRCKASLGTALLHQMRDYDLDLLSPEDLFFWPNGDIGLIVSLSGENFVHRFNPSGTHVLSSFKTGSESFSEPNHFLGFFPDGTLILSDKNRPDSIAQYRKGRKVTSFSKALKILRERMEIQSATVLSTGDLVIAGNPAGNDTALQFVIMDSSGKGKKGFIIGKAIER